MPWILSSSVVVLLAVLVWGLLYQMRAVLLTVSTAQPLDTPQSSPLPYNDRAVLRAIDELELRVTTLTKAVADGIDHVDRNEKRVRGIVVGATRRFENSDYYDAGVEAELETLPDEAHPFDPEAPEPVRVTAPAGPAEDAATGVIPGDWS